MKKKVNGFVSGMLSACVCISMTAAPVAASTQTFIYEDFNNGTTSLTYRKNTAWGTATSGAVENGVLKLTKSAEEGIATAYAAFSLQSEGVVKVKADICSDIDNGTLFGLSENILGADIAVCVRDNRLVLVSGEKEADGGSFSPGEWKSYIAEIDYVGNSVSLFCNGSKVAQISDAMPCRVGSITFSLTKSGKYMNIDNVSVSNDYEKEEVFWDINDSDAKDAILSLVEKGIMQGMGNGAFSPDTSLTRAQMAQIITNALGLNYNGEALSYSDVKPSAWYNYAVGAVTNAGIMQGMGDGSFKPDKLLTFEEVCKILTESANYAGLGTGDGNIGESVDKLYVSSTLSDSDAVKYDIQKLGNMSLVVFDDIELPTVGECGSSISWSSSSAYLTADGKVTRPHNAPENVVLTATVTKGSVTDTKALNICVMPSNTSWTVTASSTPDSELLTEKRGDIVKFDFDVIPGEDKLNTLFSFGPRNTTLISFSEMAVIIRFNESGMVDAYNSNTYTADKPAKYTKGEKLTITVEINMADGKYSVWVKGENSPEVKIASDFSYRATAAAPLSIGKMYIKRGSTTIPGDAEVTRMSIAAPEEIVDADKYLFNRNYASAGDATDFMASLRENIQILPGTQLPAKNSAGNDIVWISSDDRLVDENGKITTDVNENVSFTLTAVSDDASPETYYLLRQKDNISNWAFGYVATAMNMGIVKNILADESFNPKMPITREYAAVLVNRLLTID